MRAPCPGCGAELDYGTVPAYSVKKQMAGKFCPHCGHPLDKETAERETLDYGASSKAIQEARGKGAEEFVAASKGVPKAKDDKPTGAKEDAKK